MNSFNESILRSLRKISRAIDLFSRQLASRYKLTGPQLVCLRQIMQEGTITPSELARKVSLSQATVTGILDRLESRLLIVRQRNPADKRRVMIHITEQGHKLVVSAPLPLHQEFVRKLSELPPEEQKNIDQVLCQIVVMMEAEAIDASPILALEPPTADPTDVVDFLQTSEKLPEEQPPEEHKGK